MAIDMKKTIAEAASSLLFEKRVKKLTVKDIVEECHITRQAFYYHFEDIPDLIHWEHVGVALFPSLSEDQNGCFSGSAVEENGVMHLFYTGVHYNQVNPKDIHQCLDQDFTSAQLHLTSKDGMHFDVFGDKEVVIPALTDPEIGDNTHTRDPKVWKGSDAWYMVLGSTTKDHKGEALFYKSEDLSHWRLAGQATTKQKLGWMWECPDLFNVNGRSVFVFSPMELIEDTDGYADRAICMLPEFDEKTCTMKFPVSYTHLTLPTIA